MKKYSNVSGLCYYVFYLRSQRKERRIVLEIWNARFWSVIKDEDPLCLFEMVVKHSGCVCMSILPDSPREFSCVISGPKFISCFIQNFA